MESNWRDAVKTASWQRAPQPRVRCVPTADKTGFLEWSGALRCDVSIKLILWGILSEIMRFFRVAGEIPFWCVRHTKRRRRTAANALARAPAPPGLAVSVRAAQTVSVSHQARQLPYGARQGHEQGLRAGGGGAASGRQWARCEGAPDPAPGAWCEIRRLKRPQLTRRAWILFERSYPSDPSFDNLRQF